MTPDEFRQPSIEQLAGVNVFYEHGKPPVILGPGQPPTAQAATSNNVYVEFNVDFRRPKPKDETK